MTNDKTQINNSAKIADFVNGNFQDIQHVCTLTQQSIMPVVVYNESSYQPLGTCFCVSGIGFVLTARHVIDEALGLRDGQGSWPEGLSLGVLYTAKPEPGDNVPDLLGGIIPVLKVHLDPMLDIAVMSLNLPVRIATNTPIKMPAMEINSSIPKIGTECFALGYRTMDWKVDAESSQKVNVLQKYSASKGTVKNIHFPIRDRGMLRWPCFEVNARYDRGMSGGPVITEAGVIGVVCASLGEPDDEEHTSYVSLIAPALTILVDVLDDTGREMNVMLFDLHKYGRLALRSTSDVRYDRTSDALNIHLGDDRVITKNLVQTDDQPRSFD